MVQSWRSNMICLAVDLIQKDQIVTLRFVPRSGARHRRSGCRRFPGLPRAGQNKCEYSRECQTSNPGLWRHRLFEQDFGKFRVPGDSLPGEELAAVEEMVIRAVRSGDSQSGDIRELPRHEDPSPQVLFQPAGEEILGPGQRHQGRSLAGGRGIRCRLALHLDHGCGQDSGSACVTDAPAGHCAGL